MASNSTNQIAIYRDVSAVATASLSPQETGVRVRAIPNPSTTVQLPGIPFPNDGDSYEVIDADGSCSPANLLLVVPPAGTLIRGLGVFVLSTAFASARFTFDGSADTWLVEFFSGGAAPPLGSAVWVDVPAGTALGWTLADEFLSFDSTAAQSSLNLPAAASLSGGETFFARLTGTTRVTPVLLNAGAGTTIELVGGAVGPGSFGASTYLPYEAMIVAFKYDKATTQWKQFQLSLGSAAAAKNATLWEVDYTAGNDANSGAGGSALATVAEIRRRWNGGLAGVRPQMPAIDMVVNVTGSPAASFSDPISVLCDIDAQTGFTMLIDFAVTVKRSGTIAAVPNPFARTTTGQQTVTDLAIADWTPDVDQPIRDNTSGAWAWVVAGGSPATLSAARASPLTTAAAQRNLVNLGLGAAAIAPTNLYDILTLTPCYFGTGARFRLTPGGADASGTGLAVITIRHAHGLAQSTQDECEIEGTATFTNSNGMGAAIEFVECRCDQPRRQYGGVCWLNCAAPENTPDLMSGAHGSSSAFLCGYARHNVFLAQGGQVDQDFAILGSFSLNTSSFTGSAGAVILGNVGRFLMGGADLTGFFHNVGTAFVQADYDAQGVFYGTTGIRAIVTVGFNQVGGCVLDVQETAATAFNFNGGAAAFFNMGGGQSGVAFDTAAGAFVAGLRNLSVANLDATVAAGGFGQHALWPATQCAILVHL